MARAATYRDDVGRSVPDARRHFGYSAACLALATPCCLQQQPCYTVASSVSRPCRRKTPSRRRPRSSKALPANATGEQIFRAACATCHGVDGTGSPAERGRLRAAAAQRPRLSRFHRLPDQHRGAARRLGGRGHTRRTRFARSTATCRRSATRCRATRCRVGAGHCGFCTDPAWPRGDLNLPRAFFTEKAFPENETVWTTGVTGSGARAVHQRTRLRAPHRGARPVRSARCPLDFQQTAPAGSWSRGLGDVELAVRRTFYASYERGSIFAAGAAVTLPTGKEERGLGNGFTVYEPFAMWGQMLGVERVPAGACRLRDSVRSASGTNEGVRAHGARLHHRPGPGARARVVADGRSDRRQAGGRRHRVGRRAADAGVAQQAAARPGQRRRPRAAQPARQGRKPQC